MTIHHIVLVLAVLAPFIAALCAPDDISPRVRRSSAND